VKRAKRCLFCFSLVGLFFSFGSPSFSTSGLAGQKKTILEIPAGSAGLIGYGSLMSLPSMEQTLGRKYEGPTYLVHLVGYQRSWTHLRLFNEAQAGPAESARFSAYYLQDGARISVDGAVELTICPIKDGRMNAVLYVMPDKDLIRFDKRERTYIRVDVANKVEEYDFKGGKVYVYIGLPDQPGKPAPDPRRYILFKEYLDQVTGACDRIGQPFRDEFDKSTRPTSCPVVPFGKVVWEKVS
jgi:hypothetical protein